MLLAAGGVSADEDAELARVGLPWLHVNQRGPDARRYVVLDDERAAAMAVEHLVDLGHRRIAHLAGPREIDSARRRRHGHTKAMRLARITSERSLVVAADYPPDGGADAMRRLLQSPQPPTAVFVANVASAIGALHAAAPARGTGSSRRPFAVHDLALAGRLVPPLTTVRMPLAGLGALAVELLLGRPADSEIHEVVRDPIDPVIRESTAPLPV